VEASWRQWLCLRQSWGAGTPTCGVGLVKGAYGAVIGTILGAGIPLGRIAIGDWLTATIDVISLAVLFH
jgi:hypothetical protein